MTDPGASEAGRALRAMHRPLPPRPCQVCGEDFVPAPGCTRQVCCAKPACRRAWKTRWKAEASFMDFADSELARAAREITERRQRR